MEDVVDSDLADGSGGKEEVLVTIRFEFVVERALSWNIYPSSCSSGWGRAVTGGSD